MICLLARRRRTVSRVLFSRRGSAAPAARPVLAVVVAAVEAALEAAVEAVTAAVVVAVEAVTAVVVAVEASVLVVTPRPFPTVLPLGRMPFTGRACYRGALGGGGFWAECQGVAVTSGESGP